MAGKKSELEQAVDRSVSQLAEEHPEEVSSKDVGDTGEGNASEEKQGFYKDEEILNVEKIEDLELSKLTPGQRRIMSYAEERVRSAAEQIKGSQQNFRAINELRQELGITKAEVKKQLEKIKSEPVDIERKKVWAAEDEADPVGAPYRAEQRAIKEQLDKMIQLQESLKSKIAKQEEDQKVTAVRQEILAHMRDESIPSSRLNEVEDYLFEVWKSDDASGIITPIGKSIKDYKKDMKSNAESRIKSIFSENPDLKKRIEKGIIEELARKQKGGEPVSPQAAVPTETIRKKREGMTPDEAWEDSLKNLAEAANG